MSCRIPAFWMAAGLVVGSAVPVVGQSIYEGFLECSTMVQWQSNCEKPLFDLDAQHGQRGLNDAQFEFSEYKRCLGERAQNDVKTVQRGIFGQAQRELNLVKENAVIWGFSVQ